MNNKDAKYNPIYDFKKPLIAAAYLCHPPDLQVNWDSAGSRWVNVFICEAAQSLSSFLSLSLLSVSFCVDLMLVFHKSLQQYSGCPFRLGL